MSYAAVPDAEHAAAVLPASQVLIQKAKEKYPDIKKDLNALFLGRLDDAMENAKPRITIPRLSLATFDIDEVDGDGVAALISPSEVPSLIQSLQLPTAALAVTLLSGLLTVLSNSSLALILYPYYSCVLTFVASIPAIRRRFLESVKRVFDKTRRLQEVTESRVETFVQKGKLYLSTTEQAMSDALKPIKTDLDRATQAEAMLKLVNPDINIPDTKDIEEKFEKFQTQLSTGLDRMQGAVDISRNVPPPLRSMDQFELWIVIPFLAVTLVLQLVGVYVTVQRAAVAAAAEATLSSVNETDSGDNMLTWGNSTMSPALSSANETLAPSALPDISEEAIATNEWSLMWFAIQSYVFTVTQILLAFILSQTRILVGLVNWNIAMLEANVNGRLDAELGDVFETVFNKGFDAVKVKFFRLLRAMEKLDLSGIRGTVSELGKIHGKLGDKLGGFLK